MTPWLAMPRFKGATDPLLGGFLLKYAVASVVCALLAGMVLTLTYRHVSIQGIADLAQQDNIAHGRMVVQEPGLIDYLESTVDAGGIPALPPNLSSAIAGVLRERDVVRVKLYNVDGLVVYSSRSEQIGRKQFDNPAFREAMMGEVAAKFFYRDVFSFYEPANDDNNLVQTYMPLRSRPNGPVRGVLELYADVNALVQLAQQGEYRILSASALIVPLLWGGLLLFVRRTTQALKAQQELIRERNATLTTLSAHMLEAEEARRKRLAIELNEGLAQTLSAIKLSLESVASGSAEDVRNESKAVVPLLQQTIGEVRSHAAALRPSSLDDLGLHMTLSALFRAVCTLRPDLVIQKLFMPADSEVPTVLKIVIYRCLETALYSIARLPGSRRVQVGLRVDDEAITLIIDHDGNTAPESATPSEQRAVSPINLLRERVVLSRGELFVHRNELGETTIRARWPHQARPNEAHRDN